jgi:GT2 family glycosyltransferase
MRKPHAFSALERLHYIPWPVRVHIITEGKTWAQAINIGLKRTEGDVILMDDDVFLNQDTFSTLDKHYYDGDIFGFKLFFPDGKLQHAGGVVRDGSVGHIGHGLVESDPIKNPYYVCHATTSLIYIKRRVIETLGGMAEDIPGVQMEDVDFSFRALKAGFRILFLPASAIHMESASKRFIPHFQQGVQQAFKEVQQRHLLDAEFVRSVESYPKPLVEMAVV